MNRKHLIIGLIILGVIVLGFTCLACGVTIYGVNLCTRAEKTYIVLRWRLK